MTERKQEPSTFNGPLEAGIRAVSILAAAYPQAYDLQRLVALGSLASADIPTTIADSFAQTVESILTEWNFPEAGRVYFEAKTRDLVISGKSRSAFGKGLRAITHAAFTLGLVQHGKTMNKRMI